MPRLWKRVDWFLIVLVFIASAMGVVAIAGVSGHGPHALIEGMAKKQLIWIALGCITLCIFTAVDYHVWQKWHRAMYGGLLLLLMAVLVIGHHKLGASRWIPLGPFEFQPSEFAKLMLVFWLSGILAPQLGEMLKWRQVLLPTVSAAAPAALIAVEPDLGSSLVFMAALVGITFAAGFPGERIMLVIVFAIAVAVGAVLAHLYWHIRKSVV